jgi:hypothetical protein
MATIIQEETLGPVESGQPLPRVKVCVWFRPGGRPAEVKFWNRVWGKVSLLRHDDIERVREWEGRMRLMCFLMLCVQKSDWDI